MRDYFHLVLAAFLMGCGGASSNDNFTASGSLSNALPTVSGRVVSETGVPQGGVRVVVHERTSNAKFEGMSSGDGTFSLSVDQGVYDVGLDLTGDTKTASCFYGPFDTATASAQDFVLHDRGGRTASTVFGKIWLQAGTPAPRRSLNLVSGFAHKQTSLPAAVAGRTQADGSFELSLPSGNELALDVEVYDGQEQLDEFIDVGKLEKPCYAEFVTEQSPVENRFRSGESELSGNLSSKAADTTGLQKFQLDYSRSLPTYEFTAGNLPVNKVSYLLSELTDSGPVETGTLEWVSQQINYGKIRLDTNGMWWWKYAVNFSVGETGVFTFTDASTDNYTLFVISETPISPTWRKVSYNSKSPNLTRIQASGI